MDPPKVRKVMGLDLKRGCYTIAVIGLSIAIGWLVLLIFYALIDAILTQVQGYTSDGSVKKAVMVIILVNAVMLIISSGYLLVATIVNKPSAYELSAYLMFLMLTIDIIIVGLGPTACFFAENACTVIKKSSYIFQVVVLMGLMIHMDLWSYYMVCVYNASLQSRLT